MRAAVNIAETLHKAQTTATEVPSFGDLTVDEAYAAQHALIALKERDGETVTGVKLGFTSEAKMRQMGVSEVIVGRITDAMDGRTSTNLIHPKAEPEIAYRLARDVDGSTPILECVDAVAAAIEIIDSRYENFRFTYTDVIADNTSAAGYVIGAWQPMTDVSDRAVRLTVGTSAVEGSTSAILGDPANALVALEEVARKRGIPLKAGYVVLAGAATVALPLTDGYVECSVDGLAPVSFEGRSR
ncbi:2-keto-4-pentenoate hydratase [Lentzea sp. NPDC058450]|uniref:2-keto-4-pentenoate hydratase n=1 Tax=Lentzea sp. NPDC058450 TaxID=3346505 RepID=UPI00364C68D4